MRKILLPSLLLSFLIPTLGSAVRAAPNLLEQEAAFSNARRQIQERRGSLDRHRCEENVRRGHPLADWQRVALLVDCNSTIERSSFERCRSNVLTALADPAAGAVVHREVYLRVVNGCAREYLSAYMGCVEEHRVQRGSHAEADCAELR